MMKEHEGRPFRTSAPKTSKPKVYKPSRTQPIREATTKGVITNTSFEERIKQVEHIEKPKYEGEMLERELKAQEEIKVKQSRTAPLYNKGGYQYISDEMDLTTIGRKV